RTNGSRECSSAVKSACLPRINSCFWSSVLLRPCVELYACNPHIQALEVRGSEVQGYHQLNFKLKASMEQERLFLLILIACGLQLMAQWTSLPGVFFSPSVCLCLLLSRGASRSCDSRLYHQA
ncbi:mCG1042660, isoform CRA_b, partial [Mus musculus]